MKTLFAALFAVAAFTAPVHALEVHGQTDFFAGHGVTLAWAILQGPDEARTKVVVRVVTDRSIRWVSMKGIDPFTKAEKTFFDVIPSPGDMLMRVDRARFAAFPRTEWTFHGEGKDARLTVFYLGVPDTTPEFADEAKLEAYLGKRLNSAR